MPTYNYRCSNCGDFKYKHKIGDKLEKCPKCGRIIKKIFKKAPGINFNGNGFYSNNK
jgi:putative FmdB family regulatory protein